MRKKFFLLGLALSVFASNVVVMGGPILEQFQSEVEQIVDKVSPSVVTIYATQIVKAPLNTQMFPGLPPFMMPGIPTPEIPEKEKDLGSGIILNYIQSKNAFIILTNNHVVGNSKDVMVKLSKTIERKAKVLGRDPKTDLAVLEVSAEGIDNPSSKVATLGDSSNVRIGQLVIAIGNPYGFSSTVTMGVVSALNRRLGLSQYEDYIQTDAAINPGNSGGPLINIEGKVIGINTAMVKGGQGLGFAIPINLAKWVYHQIMDHGKVIRGWLGVSIQQITPQMASSLGVNYGAIVAQVFPGSPAQKYGLKVGDIIVSMDGKPLESVDELQFKTMESPPGTVLTLGVIRNHKLITVKVKTAKMPSNTINMGAVSEAKDLGLMVRPLNPQEQRHYEVKGGLLVEDVLIGSPAYEAGIRAGDIILSINLHRIYTKAQMNEILERLVADHKNTATFLIDRNGQNIFVTVNLK